MKIVRKDETGMCRFDELKVGDVFIEDCDGSAFIQMKIMNVNDGGDICNAVSLSTGVLYAIDSDELVKQVNAELIITNV